MSTVIAKNIQIGTSGTPAQNFTWYQPAAPDGTVRLGVGNTGATTSDVITATSAGNVGIGTSSPSGRLDVLGSNASTSDWGNVNVTSRNVINAANRIYTGLRLQDSGSGDAGAIGYSYNGTGYNMMFATVPGVAGAITERMRITSDGNVGIGTSSPARRLHVFSSVAEVATLESNFLSSDNVQLRFRGTSGERWAIGNNVSTGGTGVNFDFYDLVASANRVRIDGSGRLLVGTNSAPGQTGGVIVANNELFVYNIPTTASGANCNISSGESNRFYRSTSALKYKQDIRDIESIDINKFRPVRYKSKCENDDQTKDHFGIIADEVHAAGLTELVSYGADGEVEGFQYDRLTVVLLKAIQEQQALIESLTARIAALEAK